MSPVSTTPETEYAQRLEQAQALFDQYAHLDDSIANWRLSVFFIGVGVALLAAFTHWFSLWWVGIFAVAFLSLVLWQRPVYTKRKRYERIIRHYTQGLQRIRGGWQGKGVRGTHYAEPDHPYAGDLDLFGPGSLFELLCTARTSSGERILAKWLLAPSEKESILARQAAVRELSPDIDLREKIALEGEDVRASIDPDGLVSWAVAPIRLPASFTRLAALITAGATLVAAVIWAARGPSLPFYILVVIGQLIAWRMGAPGQKAVRSFRVVRDLELLSGLLKIVEQRKYHAPLLQRLHADLQTDGALPSQRIRELERLVGFLSAVDNQLFRPIGAILLWKPQFAFAIEAWRARNGARIASWLEIIGEFEALTALSAYASEHPLDIFPEIAASVAVFHAGELAHPLLPAGDAVPNDVSIGDKKSLWIVSGSNMSGKSTLLRTIGINTVLALAGAPVRARSLKLGVFHLGTSIRTQDSLQGGISRFYAEITRIHQVVDIAHNSPPALFLLDEILHGTNSHDRLIGAEGIVRSLVHAGAIGLITTHDLALARLENEPELRVENVHFEDHMKEGRMVFDYKLRQGMVTKSNAIALMRAVGLDV